MRTLRRSKIRAAVVVSMLLFVAIALGFALASKGRDAQSIDERARHIGLMLACPVCQGLSVADSPSQLATQMRSVIRQKLDADESDAQILRYFEDAYGESILLDPPRHGFWLLIWLAPIAVSLGGVLVVARVAQSLVARSPADTELSSVDFADETTESYRARVEAEEISV